MKIKFILLVATCVLVTAKAERSLTAEVADDFVSPQATFGTAKQAMVRGDYDTFCLCFSKDGISLLAGSLRMMTGMIEWAGKQENADERSVQMAKELGRINRRYLKSQQTAEIQLDLNASSEDFMASVRKRAEPINNHSGYVAAIFKLLLANDNRPNKNPPLADAVLKNLKVEGKSATAVMSGTFLERRKSEKPMTFRRVGLAWKIEQLGGYGIKTTVQPRKKTKKFNQNSPLPKIDQNRIAKKSEKFIAPVLPAVQALKPIDRPDEKGFSQLHRAREVEVAQALIDQGADVDVRQRNFHGTPLQYAASFGRLDVVQLLLKHKATVDAVDLTGRTPLMWAAWRGHTEVIETLLEAGADFKKTSRGTKWTALHFAADKGQFEAAQLLMERGASPTAKNIQGKTPLDLNPNIAPLK